LFFFGKSSFSLSGETTASHALKTMHANMSQDVVGRRILAEKPYINSDTLDMQRLSQSPVNTLGHAYYRFMSQRGFDADDRYGQCWK
jgi:ubiquinone biosynthesis protein COQ4